VKNRARRKARSEGRLKAGEGQSLNPSFGRVVLKEILQRKKRRLLEGGEGRLQGSRRGENGWEKELSATKGVISWSVRNFLLSQRGSPGEKFLCKEKDRRQKAKESKESREKRFGQSGTTLILLGGDF